MTEIVRVVDTELEPVIKFLKRTGASSLYHTEYTLRMIELLRKELDRLEFRIEQGIIPLENKHEN